MSALSFKNYITGKVKSIIADRYTQKPNLIFVFMGISDLVDIEIFKQNITDRDTFLLEADSTFFGKEWFTKIFTELNNPQTYHIISYAQYNYLIHYIDADFFKDRTIIISDNLRRLYPIEQENFIEQSIEENIEERPANLPIYQIEQIRLNNKFYFSAKSPSEDLIIEDIFVELMELKHSQKAYADNVIDVCSDRYALDVFINDCIAENDFSKKVIVKFFNKQPFNIEIETDLKRINFVLCQFGGQLFLLDEISISDQYEVKSETKKLLKQFWGDNADFRELHVYKNPNIDKEIISISQGFIVDTIIDEYEKSKKNTAIKDLFLTAPTGAGKSLLFQLPAFYVSQKGDVTIIVSPLIALMKDQVRAIINDRKFDKVAYVNSELSLIDRDRIIDSCKNGGIDVLYLSPELLLSYDISFFIGDRTLGLLVIDEAHLITTWGRDFRVDYWFLGNHIRKIRKYKDCNFPMVAVTATAIYGGANDMVFDSIDSLFMQNPHIFIGQVKRNDIEFVVNNYEKFPAYYEKNKIEQTADFIKKVKELNLKTIVYTPYTKHINQILDILKIDSQNIATGYYGTLDSMLKEFAYRQFKSGETNIMVCTKAFGMGVDISDIQVVYHHAPSGLLPDYVQEIGRVARKTEIQGYATLNYSTQDQRFSKILHGMSALRQYQLREVLRKIYKTFLKNNKSRNLLLSVDDFGYIFENAFDLDQKVLTALMMIEKDYLAKHRFNVLIARPKKLFAKVYARLTNEGLTRMNLHYQNTFQVISNPNNGNNIIELDLDKIWYKHFSNKSFPVMKHEFYLGKLFQQHDIELFPQIKMSVERTDSFANIYQSLYNFFTNVQNIFASFSGYFNQNQFQEHLNTFISDKKKSEKISKFILSSYSGRLLSPGVIENDAFLQLKKTIDGFEYRVYNTRYLENFALLLKRLSNLFGNNESHIVNKYVANKEINAVNYIRLGYFLEMLELGTFEMKGGENPMVFVRINDPYRIEKDSNSLSYRNTLLQKTIEKHSISNQIFDHFFLRNFTNDERWNFIEDFFLGSEVDDLLESYQGSEGNNIDIIEYLRTNTNALENNKKTVQNISDHVHVFYANPEVYYEMDNLLTIDTSEGTKTLKVSQWLSKDPVSFDIVKRKFNLKISKQVFDFLVSKLRQHKEYFRDLLGLKMKIEFKGYDKPVSALVPYTTQPVDFYKWWCKNEDKVTLSEKDKIILFDKIKNEAPKILLKKHSNML